LDKLINHKNIINFARAQNLGWYGHVERMQETRMVKAIHSWKPISKRPTGRPKIRWEDVRKRYTEVNSAKLEDLCPGWKKMEGSGWEGQNSALRNFKLMVPCILIQY